MEAARPRERGRRRRRVSRPRYGGSAPPPRRVSCSDRSSSDAAAPPPPCTDFDMAYFKAYAHVGVHEDMIKDRVRTETYRNAIMQHQSYIDGKVVVDVGCGTGILSIFCAQAGAKKVYAVDASDIAVQANEVVKANNLSGTVIVLHGRVEDVQIHEKVDVIVSEWMGYMLLYESMLGSVITARDRWLKPGGLLLPSNATLYMAPVTHPDRYNKSIDFWRNVYGINMSAMLPLAKQCAFEEPCVETITGENVLTWPHVVKHVDCYTITAPELESVTTRFKFQSMLRAPLHGFAFWFDVEFGIPAIPSASNQAPLPILPISYVPSHDHSISLPVADGPPNGHSIPLPVADEPSNDHSVLVPDADESSSDHLIPLLPDVDEPSSDHSIAPLPVADETLSNEPSNDHSAPVPVANEPLSDHSTPLPDAGEPSNDHSTPLPDADEPSNDHSLPPPDADEPSGVDSIDGSQRKKRANPNKALILSTSPEDPSTHWQQTLIYFYEPIELEQDQVIEGSATLTQNRQHARFMNIRIDYTSGGRSFVKYAVMR